MPPVFSLFTAGVPFASSLLSVGSSSASRQYPTSRCEMLRRRVLEKILPLYFDGSQDAATLKKEPRRTVRISPPDGRYVPRHQRSSRTDPPRGLRKTNGPHGHNTPRPHRYTTGFPPECQAESPSRFIRRRTARS